MGGQLCKHHSWRGICRVRQQRRRWHVFPCFRLPFSQSPSMTAKASDEDSPLATGAVLSPLSMAFILSTNCCCNRFSFRVHVKIHAWNLPTLSPAVTPCRLNLLLFVLAWWLEMQSWPTHFRPARWKAAGCSCVIWLGTSVAGPVFLFWCFSRVFALRPGVDRVLAYQ